MPNRSGLENFIDGNKWAFDFFRVLPKQRALWGCAFKAASTTLSIALSKVEGVAKTQFGDEEVTRLSDFGTGEIAEILTASDWFRFTMVRDPYDRLFSAYKSKIGNLKAEEYYQGIQDEIRQRYDYPTVDGRRVGIVAFRDFVRFVQEVNDRDPHWSRQDQLVRIDRVPYDFIGRCESFAEDFRTIMERLGADQDMLGLGAVRHGESYRMPLAAAYDSELARSVYDFYETDFERFGYDRESWRFGG